jgi:putative addiction module component (TIGR02574 family)
MGARTFRLTESQEMELDRRLKELDANPNLGSPWEEVIARMRKIAKAGKKSGDARRRRNGK